MKVDSRFYMHPDDKTGLKALQAIPGFSALLKAYMKLWAERQRRVLNMSCNLRISERQLSKYYRMLPPICQKLGIEVPEIRINHLEGNEHYTYRGEPVSCDLKVADIHMNGFVIELHQPIGGPSSFQEFLDKHGNGVHHIGFEVGAARDAVISDLTAAGYDTDRTLGIYPGSSWTIVDGEDTLGVNLNIKPVR